MLADDDRTFRETTRALLVRNGYECLTARDAHEAKRLLAERRWDALLTDVLMPGSEELAYLTQQSVGEPVPSILVITAYPDVRTAVTALRLSAADYLAKPVDITELLAATARAVARTRRADRERSLYRQIRTLASLTEETPSRPAPPANDGRSCAGPDLGRLSARERDIVAALQNGHRTREIAEALSLSVHTVRNHLHSIFRKLGVSSQVELLAELRHTATSD